MKWIYTQLLMKYLEYIFFMLQKGLISLIPLKLLYAYSDVIYFFLFHVFRYRLEIVRRNLQNSFPEKDSAEINEIIRKFYRNLSDITVETLRGYSLKLNELQKRYVFRNIELPNSYHESKRDIILAMSHYCNWEWGSQVAGSVFRHSLLAFYKPLSNRKIDDYIKRHRAARKMTLLPVDRPRLLKPDEKRPAAYLFISDQNPDTSKVHWTRFLNQETAFSRGIEVYAKHYNMPVLYVDIQRTRRGFYTVRFEELVTDPLNTADGEITERYMKKLESIIVRKPENWLWSHRRWKQHRHSPSGIKEYIEPELAKA